MMSDKNPFSKRLRLLNLIPERPLNFHSGTVWKPTPQITSGALYRFLVESGYDFGENVTDVECREFERLCHIRFEEARASGIQKSAREIAFEADAWYRTLAKNHQGRRLCNMCGHRAVQLRASRVKIDRDVGVSPHPYRSLRCCECNAATWPTKNPVE